MRNLIWAALMGVACGASSKEPKINPDAGSEVPLNRGPWVLLVDGDPNGLWWQDGVLYLADDNGNRILRWTDAQGFGLVADLPAAAPSGAGLGQLIRMADGTWIVTRFGGGSAGDIVFIPPGGTAQIVPGLSPERRRIGLTVTQDGRLFDGWFVRLSSGERVGAVGELNLAGTETEVITGLKKPVGVLAVGSDLYVSDQDLGQILRAPLTNPSGYSVYAMVPGPDLLAAGPSGVLFAGSTEGAVYRLDNGTPSVLVSGYQAVRGLAYDPIQRRLFIVDHDPDGDEHRLHCIPVD